MTASRSAGPGRWRAAALLAIFVAVFILAEVLLLALVPIPEDHGNQFSLGPMLVAEGVLLAGVLIGTTVMALVERRSIGSYG